MDERERLHTRYLFAAWLEAVKAARQISSPTSGTGETSSVHATSTCEMELRPNFMAIYIEFLPEKKKKKVISGFKRTKPRIYYHFLFVAFSIHWGGSFLTFGVFRFSWSLLPQHLFHTGLQCEIQNNNKKTPSKVLFRPLLCYHKNFWVS